MSWQIALYAVLSLTIVRMLPVALCLLGTQALAPTVAFIGWFGPRGLASIVFAVIVEDTHQAHGGTILTACYLTVGLSVLLHGLSAAPLVSRYAAWYRAAAGVRPPAMESSRRTSIGPGEPTRYGAANPPSRPETGRPGRSVRSLTAHGPARWARDRCRGSASKRIM